MVDLPQQTVPSSSETAITSDPNTSRRLYGPAQPSGGGSPLGAETSYTVPAGLRTTITFLLAINADLGSPPATQTFTLSIGDDAPDTRIFNDSQVDPGFPVAIGLEITLEEGEYIQALPTGVTLTINGREVAL